MRLFVVLPLGSLLALTQISASGNLWLLSVRGKLPSGNVCVYARYLLNTSCTDLSQYVASTYIAVQELELPVSVHAHVPLLDVAFAGAARLHLRAHKHDACTRNTYGMRMYGLGTTYLHLHTSIPKPYILIPHSNVSSIW